LALLFAKIPSELSPSVVTVPLTIVTSPESPPYFVPPLLCAEIPVEPMPEVATEPLVTMTSSPWPYLKPPLLTA